MCSKTTGHGKSSAWLRSQQLGWCFLISDPPRRSANPKYDDVRGAAYCAPLKFACCCQFAIKYKGRGKSKRFDRDAIISGVASLVAGRADVRCVPRVVLLLYRRVCM